MSTLSGLGLQLSAMLLLLGGVAAVLVRLGRRAPQKSDGPLELLARIPLEGRRAVYLVRAGKRVLVVGSSENGLAPLADFEERELAPSPALEPSVPQSKARPTHVSAAELLGHGETPTPPRSAWHRQSPEEVDAEDEGYSAPTLARQREGALRGED